MAARTRSTELASDYYDDETPRSRRGTGGSRASWWFSRLLAMFLILAVLLWFAPTIVANTSVWNWALAKVKAQTNYDVQTGRPSLGWFSPVTIPAIEVRCPKGDLIAQLDAVQLDKTLFALATNSNQLGTITLVKPRARIVLPPPTATTTSPVEPSANEPSAAAMPTIPQLALRIIDGAVEIVDPVSNQVFSLQGIEGGVDTPAAADQPFKVGLALQVAANQQPAGAAKINAEFLLPPGQKPLGEALVELIDFETAATQGLLKSAGLEIAPRGRLTLKTAVRMDQQGLNIRLDQFAGTQFAVSAPQALGPDVVSIQQLGGQGELSIQGDLIVAKQIVIASELARVEADGILRLGEHSLAGLFQAFAKGQSNEPLQVAAQVDVARLMQMLPNTIRLRPGTQIQSGQITLQVQRDPQSPQPRVTGVVKTSDLVAVNEGRQIRWDKPISASFAVSQSPQGPQLEQLTCTADFLKLEGAGSLAGGQATFQGDLNRLMTELDKVVDLPELQMAGTLAGQIDWKHGQGDQWGGQTTVNLKNFVLQSPGMQPWQEKDLSLTAIVDGLVGAEGLQQINVGTATIVSGNDRCDARLTKPVAAPFETAAWPVSWKVTGSLASWLARLQPVAPLKDLRAEGTFELAGAAAVSPTAVVVDKATLHGQQIRAVGFGLFIDEDELQLETTAAWDQKNSRVNVPVTTFASSTLAFRADQMQVTYGDAGFSATGTLDYRGDIERLTMLTEDPQKPVTTRILGELGGRLTLAYREGVTDARLSSSINELVYATLPEKQTPTGLVSAPADAWKVQWKEPKVALQGGVAYDAAKDTLSITNAAIQASQLKVMASGGISGLSTTPLVDVRGSLTYDMADIAQKLRPMVGESLVIEGKEERAFALVGPLGALSAATGPMNPQVPQGLVSNDLQGEASIGWQTAEYLGMTFGRADVQAKLQKGVVNFAPLSIPVSSGKFVAQPQILLNAQPPVATLERGPLLDHVEISPELCRGWLMFVAPLVANATNAEGKFSVDMEGATVPLLDPIKCDVAGAFKIHNAKVGPGPTTAQLITMVKTLRGMTGDQPFDPASPDGKVWMQMGEQKVDFRVVDGRVHHRGMKFVMKDVEITTDGSVGFDETVEMVANIPIQEAWLKKDLLAAGLKGQVIQVPIRGHISKPQLDNRALEEMSKKLIKGAAQGLIDDQLKKGFQKLFGPKP